MCERDVGVVHMFTIENVCASGTTWQSGCPPPFYLCLLCRLGFSGSSPMDPAGLSLAAFSLSFNLGGFWLCYFWYMKMLTFRIFKMYSIVFF